MAALLSSHVLSASQSRCSSAPPHTDQQQHKSRSTPECVHSKGLSIVGQCKFVRWMEEIFQEAAIIRPASGEDEKGLSME
jgi:hypothetical protein